MLRALLLFSLLTALTGCAFLFPEGHDAGPSDLPPEEKLRALSPLFSEKELQLRQSGCRRGISIGVTTDGIKMINQTHLSEEGLEIQEEQGCTFCHIAPGDRRIREEVLQLLR